MTANPASEFPAKVVGPNSPAIAEAGRPELCRQERTLFALCREMPVEIVFVRTEDIPIPVPKAAIDMALLRRLTAERGSC